MSKIKLNLVVMFIFLFPVMSIQASSLVLNQAVQAMSDGHYSQAYSQFTVLAKRGNVQAQVLLGIMYKEGYGIQSNLDFARHWFQQAAFMDDPAAQYMLGLTYIDPLAKDKDEAQAYEWISRAAHNQNREARHFLMLTHRHGWLGMPVSSNLSSYWQ